MKQLFALIFTAFVLETQAQSAVADTWLLEQKLPEWAVTAFKKSNAAGAYRLADYINPFYIEADFNGDTFTDIAVAIEHASTRKKGIAIIHKTSGEYYLFGAGKDFGNGGDDFNWMDIWRVYTAKKINPGVGESKTVSLNTKAIYVAKSESSSAVIYYSGGKYKWHQQGD